ncbi:MAG TPA: class I SAM-dependent methyltransferase [Acidimicrobiales bacterium]|nr:class I SAM-dependent methyltransferase [Acidimicrobiales bacterium]
MSEVVPTPDVNPEDWADPAATYDHLADAYAERFLHELDDKPFDRGLLVRFAHHVGERSSVERPVCDVGCGPGHIGAFLAERGVSVIGIDLSEGMVAEARRLFPSIDFFPGDMRSLARADASLTAIVCFYALIHIPRADVPLVIREMRRVLVEEGSVLLAVHGGAGSLHATQMVERPANLDATLFGLDELTGLVEDAGFAIEEARQREPYEHEHPTPRLYVWARRRA